MKILIECNATGMDRAAILDEQGIEIDDERKLSNRDRAVIVTSGIQLTAKAMDQYTGGKINAQELFDAMMEAFDKYVQSKEQKP